MSLKGKIVLVTGATGFIGANVVRKAIESKADVHILTRNESNKWRIFDCLQYANNYIVDLLDYKQLESTILGVQPDFIFHNAAYIGTPNEENPVRYIQNNFFGTVNLINACKKVDFKLFVNLGSMSEYGNKTKPIREDDFLEPVNVYGISKSATTQYCQAISRNESLPIVTLRLFTPYGKYEDSARLIPSAIIACLRGDAPKISSRSFVRDFIYVEDVLDAYVKLIDANNIYGEIFNIGFGKQYSIGEVVDKIIELTGKSTQVDVGLAQKWPNEAKYCEADISKAKNLLGWEPKYDLEKGLKESIKWFEQNINLYS
jgi:nucleoside-diphosphate-sugar epimerase